MTANVPPYGGGNGFMQYLMQMFARNAANVPRGTLPQGQQQGAPIPRPVMPYLQQRFAHTNTEQPNALGQIIHMAHPAAYQGTGPLPPDQEAQMTAAMNPFQKAAWTGQGDPGQFIRQGNHLVTQQVASGLNLNDWLAKQSGQPAPPPKPFVDSSLVPLPKK